MVNKLFYTALWMTVLSFTLCGCDKDNDPEDELPTDTPLVLTGKIYAFDPEKTSEEWKKGKDIGIFFMKEDGKESINSYENVLYKSIEVPAAHFAPPVGSDPIYFPQDGSKANLIAYYPYSATLTENRIAMDISNQKSASPYNFLYSNNCKGINKDNNKVEMKLYPVLSQVVVDFIAGEGVTDEYLKEATAILKGIHSKAQYNLLTGQFENYDAKKDITMIPSETINSDTAQVISTTSLNGYQLYVSLPKMNRKYTWDLSKEFAELKQGYRHICKVTISLDNVDIKTSEEPISDWGNGGSSSGSIEENWLLKTINDLPVCEITSTDKDTPEAHEASNWLFISKVKPVGKTTVEYEPSLKQNVLHCQVSTVSSWFGTYVAYRMQKPSREKYTLKFKIKGTNNMQMKCIIRNRADKVIMLNKTDTKYKGAYTFNLTSGFAERTVDFDFSQQIKSVWEDATSSIDTEEDVLENLFIQFSPMAANTEFYLYDVSLELKKN